MKLDTVAAKRSRYSRPEEIVEAFEKIHQRAMGDKDIVYMSVPVDFQRDADMIVLDAVHEIIERRRRE